jgi:hypothetical protein
VLGIGTKAYYSGAFINPIINLALGGDVASTLSIINDSANTPTALKHLCSSGKIYKVDNSAGATASTVTIGGTTGVTTATSISAWIRGGTGSIKIGAVAGQTFAASTPYVRVYQENVTPGNTTDQMVITVDAGQTVCFILPQMEVGAFITSEIVTAGATALRNFTYAYLFTNVILNNSNFTVYCELAIVKRQAAGYWGSVIEVKGNNGTDINNAVTMYICPNNTTQGFVSGYVNGVETSDNRQTLTQGTKVKCLIKSSSINGIASYFNSVKTSRTLGNPPVNLLMPKIATAYILAAEYMVLRIKNFRIYNKPLSDAKCAQLTTL